MLCWAASRRKYLASVHEEMTIQMQETRRKITKCRIHLVFDESRRRKRPWKQRIMQQETRKVSSTKYETSSQFRKRLNYVMNMVSRGNLTIGSFSGSPRNHSVSAFCQLRNKRTWWWWWWWCRITYAMLITELSNHFCLTVQICVRDIAVHG